MMGSGIAGKLSPAPCDPATPPPAPDFRLLLTKLQGYRERGDAEIWVIHPYERTLTIWRRQPDGRYAEEIYRGGVGPVASLPGADAAQSSSKHRQDSKQFARVAGCRPRTTGWHILCWQGSRDTNVRE